MSGPGSAVLAALRAVAKLLAEHDVDWAVLGALAANVYRAAPRTTFDVDLLVAVGHAGMNAVAESAEREGWEIRHLHSEGSLLRIAHDEHGAVDLLAVEMDYQYKALSRARTETLGDDIPARVLAVEDVIIHKLIANRAQGRCRHRRYPGGARADGRQVPGVLDAGMGCGRQVRCHP